jgi:D-alanyl-lipoteichoic acid acyltransferase DltB (MBOAT superfamily)
VPLPPPLFSPFTTGPPLSPTEIFAGPFGLLAYLPLIPVVLLWARYERRSALWATSVLWLVVTLGPTATAVLLGGLAAAVGWILLLGRARRRGTLSERGMIAGVWIGLHLLILPLWWWPQHAWYPSRMQVLHSIGAAYLMLRLIAWGVEWARQPGLPVRLADTICWLLYAPCMRLGPVLLRGPFLERFDAWDPRRGILWREGLKRTGLFLLGGAAIGFVGRQIPVPIDARPDFFSTPEAYNTSQLLRVFYLVPIQTYLILWTYNELACLQSRFLGLPVDNNFDWLPLARSVRDFWRRWHITLGAWLRAYLYIPLGGNRRHVPLNYLVVFGYCGIWHGASWSFLVWGLTQAAALTGQRWWDQWVAARGWRLGRWAPIAWGLGWVLTMHYQLLTILVFMDFEHLGSRILPELWRRLVSGG